MNKKVWLKIGGGCVGAAALAAGVFAVSNGQELTTKVGQFPTESSYVASSQAPVQVDADAFTAVKTGKTDQKEQSGMTIHFQWTSKQGEFPHLYYTNVNGKEGTVCTNPGVPMHDDGNGWFSYTIPDADSAQIQISVPEMSYQTTLAEKSGDDWYFAQGSWFTEDPDPVATEQKAQELAKAQEVEVQMDEADRVAATSDITVHYYSESGTPKVYYWNILPEDQEVDWPGETMESEGDGWYQHKFSDVSKVNVLFVANGQQTEDLSAKTAGDWYYDGENWTQTKPNGSGNEENTGGDEVTPTGKPTSTPVVTPRPTRDPNATIVNNDFREESIYFLMTTRFYDGDKSNNIHSDHDAEVGNGDDDPAWRGDFKGLIEKLDYIKALGFSAIWITPVVENASGYDFHGYHAINMSRVDPRYESSDTTYQDLIDACHKKGIKVVQDIVLNHTSNAGEEGMFPLLDRQYTLDQGVSGNSVTTTVKSSAKSKLDEFMSKVSKGAFSDYDAALSDTKNGPSYQYQARDQYMKSGDLVYRKKVDIGWEDFTVTTGQFAGDCMELNTEYPPVYNYLTKTYSDYIGMGVDAFRIDTVKHISRLTMNTVFIPSFKEAAKKNGNDYFYMFAEVACRTNEFINHGVKQVSPLYYTWTSTKDYGWNDASTDGKDNLKLCEQEYNDGKEVNNYGDYKNALLDGNTYHEPDYSLSSGMGVIDYGMHFNFSSAGKAFETGKAEDAYMNDSTWNVVYVDSHDYGPSIDGRNDQDGSDLWRYEGGTEAWAENLDLMFTFRGIPCIYYGSEVEFKKGLRIDNYKEPLERTGRAYFGDYLEGEVTASDYGVYSASGKVAETLSSPLAQHLQKLNRIRRAVPALQKGQYSTEGCNGGISFKRRYTSGDEDSYALVAISGGCTFSGVLDGTYVDLVTGDKKTVSGGTLSTGDLGKANMRVYVLQNATAQAYGATGKIGDLLTYLK